MICDLTFVISAKKNFNFKIKALTSGRFPGFLFWRPEVFVFRIPVCFFKFFDGERIFEFVAANRGPAKRAKIAAAAERFSKIVSQRTDVGSFAAFYPEKDIGHFNPGNFNFLNSDHAGAHFEWFIFPGVNIGLLTINF